MHAEITQEIEEYCEVHSTPEPELLYRLNRETNLKVMNPRMISVHARISDCTCPDPPTVNRRIR